MEKKNKKTYNVVLTNLSLVAAKPIKDYHNNMGECSINDNLSSLKENNYIYKEENSEKEQEVKGILTNEAGIRFVMQCLKAENDCLDAVYYVASSSAQKNMSYYNDRKERIEVNITHTQFFKERMNLYCEYNKIDLPEFLEMEIEDDPGAKSLIDLSAKIANTIIDLKENKAKDKDLNLYIESNGGFRDFMLIVVAIVQSISKDIANVKSIIGVNYKVGENEKYKHPIRNKTQAYQVYDLYSGIDEFLNYGRSDKIQNFFNPEKSGIDVTKYPDMQYVLNSINYMSDAFSLCRPIQMLDAIKELKKSIEVYELSSDKFQIFTLLTNRIKKEYGEIFNLLSKDENNIQKKGEDIIRSYEFLEQLIRYCISHNLVQQALTLYSERIPDIIYSKKILYPSTATKQYKIKRYDKEIVKEVVLNEDFKKYINLKGGPYSESYMFIQQYIFNPNSNKKGKKHMNGLLWMYNTTHSKKIYPNDTNGKCEALKELLKDGYVSTNVSIVDNNGSFNEKEVEKVVNVIRNYLEIKNERNMSNHATIHKNKDYSRTDNLEDQKVLEMIKKGLNDLNELLSIIRRKKMKELLIQNFKEYLKQEKVLSFEGWENVEIYIEDTLSKAWIAARPYDIDKFNDEKFTSFVNSHNGKWLEPRSCDESYKIILSCENREFDDILMTFVHELQHCMSFMKSLDKYNEDYLQGTPTDAFFNWSEFKAEYTATRYSYFKMQKDFKFDDFQALTMILGYKTADALHGIIRRDNKMYFLARYMGAQMAIRDLSEELEVYSPIFHLWTMTPVYIKEHIGNSFYLANHWDKIDEHTLFGEDTKYNYLFRSMCEKRENND